MNTYVFFCYTRPYCTPIHEVNVRQFLDNVLPNLRKKQDVQTCIIVNDQDHKHSGLEVAQLNANVIEIRRPNKGYDFGAFRDAALHFQLPEKKSSFHLICFNDTVFGPVFPAWLMPRPDWVEIFKKMITQDTKIGGITINTWSGKSHVQSMMFVLDEVGFRITWANDVFVERIDKAEVIQKSEIGMSQHILKAGFNITCLAAGLCQTDYRKPLEKDPGDVFLPARYNPQDPVLASLHPLDCIFFKTTRYGLNTCLIFPQKE